MNNWVQLNWPDEPGVWKNVEPAGRCSWWRLAKHRCRAEDPRTWPHPWIGPKPQFRIAEYVS